MFGDLGHYKPDFAGHTVIGTFLKKDYAFKNSIPLNENIKTDGTYSRNARLAILVSNFSTIYNFGLLSIQNYTHQVNDLNQ